MSSKARRTSIKTFGSAALLALAVLVSVGASSVMAESTQLCTTDTSPCGAPTTSIHEVSVGKAKLLTSLGTIECNVLFSSTSVGALAAPQIIKGNFTYTNCILGENNCTATEENGPVELSVLREGHETASVTYKGLVHLTCGSTINCAYNGTGLKGTAKGPLLSEQTPDNGEVSLTGQETTKEAGSGFICPKTAKLDITTSPLSPIYFGGGGGLSSTSTALSTSLKGGGKEGAEITVAEGSKVKDTATLSGENASKATGTITYKVYSDSKCEKLVTEAGKGTVKEGKVPDSEEKELEAGKEYFWQAEYGGDEMNKASTSTCSVEVLKVKAKTTISTTLSGGGKEGAEITVAEGSKVKDTATLSGANVSSATGTVDYSAYKDKECKELRTEAGKGKVEGSKAASSEEEELEAGREYFWQARYLGDSLHEESTSTCSKEVLKVKASTSLSTTLSGDGKEGEEIIIAEETEVKDQAALSGTNALSATGTIKYKVYKDEECKELATVAGEGEFKEGKTPASSGEAFSAGTYYWQAEYGGDSLHKDSASTCRSEVEVVLRSTTLCKVEPEEIEGDLFCPKGKGFSGEIEGELAPEAKAIFESAEGPTGNVSCTNAMFVGDFNENGKSPEGGGITAMSFGGEKGGPCTSTLDEGAEVAVETTNLPYDETVIAYQQVAPPQGLTRVKKKDGTVQFVLEIDSILGGTTCTYELDPVGWWPSQQGTVTNGVGGNPTTLTTQYKLKLVQEDPIEFLCPSKLLYNATFRVKQKAGGGAVFVDK